ncbi:hypothetical protein, partial [Sansalvadorimonas verongulae]|uniref:hypothetical protein n=1 Tax=Sansalvadorimonas verongulae TaxID=2172824 RepID=UPI001E5A0714
ASVLVTDKEPFPCVDSQCVHPGDVHEPLIAVRVALTHFSESAICIECTPPCTGEKSTLKDIILQQIR